VNGSAEASTGCGTTSWSSIATRFDLGLSANRGNSNQVDFNVGWQLVREDKRTLTELVYSLNLGRAEGERTVARHIVGFRNKVWITEVFFLELIVGIALQLG
jgi:hypothetical protein